MDDDGKPRLRREAGKPGPEPEPWSGIRKARASGNGQLIPLKRLPDKGWFGGVCAGIAYRLGCRPAAVRAVFVLSTLTLGIGLAAYVPLRFFLPVRRRTPKDFDASIGKSTVSDGPE